MATKKDNRARSLELLADLTAIANRGNRAGEASEDDGEGEEDDDDDGLTLRTGQSDTVSSFELLIETASHLATTHDAEEPAGVLLVRVGLEGLMRSGAIHPDEGGRLYDELLALVALAGLGDAGAESEAGEGLGTDDEVVRVEEPEGGWN